MPLVETANRMGLPFPEGYYGLTRTHGARNDTLSLMLLGEWPSFFLTKRAICCRLKVRKSITNGQLARLFFNQLAKENVL